ncbi:MAG: hypothetical protein JKY92_09940 [Magnetovibrio sp.]|nr:hypothetical protein [Magnetovibrio sp.]
MIIIRTIVEQITRKRLLAGVIMSIVMFVAMGTVTALWDNPFFGRMTAVGEWEVGLLILLSVLSGLYVVIRRPFCSNTTASVGGVIGFFGIACPVCNKILLVLFGSELLLTYYEPVRLYITILGVLIAFWALSIEWRYYGATDQTDLSKG